MVFQFQVSRVAGKSSESQAQSARKYFESMIDDWNKLLNPTVNDNMLRPMTKNEEMRPHATGAYFSVDMPKKKKVPRPLQAGSR